VAKFLNASRLSHSRSSRSRGAHGSCQQAEATHVAAAVAATDTNRTACTARTAPSRAAADCRQWCCAGAVALATGSTTCCIADTVESSRGRRSPMPMCCHICSGSCRTTYLGATGSRALAFVCSSPHTACRHSRCRAPRRCACGTCSDARVRHTRCSTSRTGHCGNRDALARSTTGSGRVRTSRRRSSCHTCLLCSLLHAARSHRRRIVCARHSAHRCSTPCT
jgi:hypothetical protein